METERFITPGELELLATGTVPLDMQDWWGWLLENNTTAIGFWLLASGIKVGPYTTAMVEEARDEMAGASADTGGVPDSGDGTAEAGISPGVGAETEDKRGSGQHGSAEDSEPGRSASDDMGTDEDQ